MAIIEKAEGWVDGMQQMVSRDSNTGATVGVRYIKPGGSGYQTPQQFLVAEQQRQAQETAARKAAYNSSITQARANAPELVWPEGYGPSDPVKYGENGCTPVTWRDPYTGRTMSNVSSVRPSGGGSVKYPTITIGGKETEVTWLGPTGRAGKPLDSPGSIIGALLPTPGEGASSQDWVRYGAASRSLASQLDLSTDPIRTNSVSPMFDQTWGNRNNTVTQQKINNVADINFDAFIQPQSQRATPQRGSSRLRAGSVTVPKLSFDLGINPSVPRQPTGRNTRSPADVMGMDLGFSPNQPRQSGSRRRSRGFGFEDWFG